MMKHVLQKLVLLTLDALGVNALFRFFNRNKALIIWYHGVCDDGFDLLKGYDERHIPKSLFRKQVEFLKRKNYVFVTLSELVETIEEKKSTKKLAVLTFDDGFRNVVENAYPIMEELSAKGCFYLVSNLIGENRLLWTDYIETLIRNTRSREFKFIFKGEQISYELNSTKSRQKAMRDIKRKLRSVSDTERQEHLRQFDDNLEDIPKEFLFADWDQIRTLNRAILEVGSHTRNHPDCRGLVSDLEFENELMNSKKDIEQRIGCGVAHYCYPGSSSFDERVIIRVNEYVKRYGYASATTTIPGLNDQNSDPYTLKRIVATENFLLFKAETSGSYLLLYELLDRVLGSLRKFASLISYSHRLEKNER